MRRRPRPVTRARSRRPRMTARHNHRCWRRSHRQCSPHYYWARGRKPPPPAAVAISAILRKYGSRSSSRPQRKEAGSGNMLIVTRTRYRRTCSASSSLRKMHTPATVGRRHGAEYFGGAYDSVARGKCHALAWRCRWCSGSARAMPDPLLDAD